MSLALIACVCAGSAVLAHRASAKPSGLVGGEVNYTVLIKEGVSRTAAIADVTRAGGTVIGGNAAIGTLVVTASDSRFAARMSHSSAVVGAAPDRPIGRILRERTVVLEKSLEGGRTLPVADARQSDVRAANAKKDTTAGLDPLDGGQWGLRMVQSDLARAVQAGRSDVFVGILSTGIDATHPDLLPNLDTARSRNFVTDIPVDANGDLVDGPCEVPGCHDPVGVDDNGLGTFLAGIVAAKANGVGLSGVAPNVTLVDIRLGQDSGLVFLQPTVDAITYAADAGIQVAVLGFTVDRWVNNCTNNPADSPASRAEQSVTIQAMARALTYAHEQGVTLIGSMGNDHQDLGKPLVDRRSPTFASVPGDAPYTRDIDSNTCQQLPVEGPHVIGVVGLGPSQRKADLSSFGVEHAEVSAPAGFFRDFVGTPQFQTFPNMVLSTIPRKVAAERGFIDADGNIVPGFETMVVKACTSTGQCGFYVYAEDTAATAAHAAGVAALIVSEHGHGSGPKGFRMDPDDVALFLTGTASEHACPEPRLQTYENEGRDATFNALCDGDASFNGFYGHGIVNALRAVTSKKKDIE